MIGMKDFTSVNIGRNSQTHTEKKVGSVELKEIYELFKSKFPTENLGLTKICWAIPITLHFGKKKWYPTTTLHGATTQKTMNSGTHSVYICTVHQNIKLMGSGAEFNRFTLSENLSLETYNICVSRCAV